MINAAANDAEPGVGGQSPSFQDSVPIHGGVPEFSGSVRDRPDFTFSKKARAAPNFYLGGGLFSEFLVGRAPPVPGKSGPKKVVAAAASSYMGRKGTQ